MEKAMAEQKKQFKYQVNAPIYMEAAINVIFQGGLESLSISNLGKECRAISSDYETPFSHGETIIRAFPEIERLEVDEAMDRKKIFFILAIFSEGYDLIYKTLKKEVKNRDITKSLLDLNSHEIKQVLILFSEIIIRLFNDKNGDREHKILRITFVDAGISPKTYEKYRDRFNEAREDFFTTLDNLFKIVCESEDYAIAARIMYWGAIEHALFTKSLNPNSDDASFARVIKHFINSIPISIDGAQVKRSITRIEIRKTIECLEKIDSHLE
jgi:hypothetical protein